MDFVVWFCCCVCVYSMRVMQLYKLNKKNPTSAFWPRKQYGQIHVLNENQAQFKEDFNLV